MTKVYAGNNHSMAIGGNFEMYVWGDGESGQLGKNISMSESPIQIDEINKFEIRSG